MNFIMVVRILSTAEIFYPVQTILSSLENFIHCGEVYLVRRLLGEFWTTKKLKVL